LRIWLALAALLASLAVEAKTTRATRAQTAKQDSRTVGLGRSCKKRSDCKGRGQVCLKESDARGKELPHGFCALPCVPLDMSPAKEAPPARTAQARDAGPASSAPDAGVTASRSKTRPLSAAEIRAQAKTNPARCPPRYLCRSKGAGVPIDLCVKG
jgi:hypothetical protein